MHQESLVPVGGKTQRAALEVFPNGGQKASPSVYYDTGRRQLGGDLDLELGGTGGMLC